MKLTYKCQLCGKEILTINGLVNHLQLNHNISTKDYYDKYMKKEGEGICKICGKEAKFHNLNMGYKPTCSINCGRKYSEQIHKNDKIPEFICKECGFKLNTATSYKGFRKMMIRHINGHNMTEKEYYDKHLKKPNEGICPVCGKPTNFINLFKGYHTYCSDKTCVLKVTTYKDYEKEKEFQNEKKNLQKAKEDEYKNYIQDLKDRVHQFDWEGERNTWETPNYPKKSTDKDNLLTDNSVSYIDGQEYTAEVHTRFEDETKDFNDIFWL